jgi:hypothetical protein
MYGSNPQRPLTFLAVAFDPDFLLCYMIKLCLLHLPPSVSAHTPFVMLVPPEPAAAFLFFPQVYILTLIQTLIVEKARRTKSKLPFS